MCASQHGPRPLPLFLSNLLQQTNSKSASFQTALAGVRKYQQAPRPDFDRRGPALHWQNGAALRLPHGTDEKTNGETVLFIPSPINSAQIFDISDADSMTGWFVEKGYRPYILDWGSQGATDQARGADFYVTEMLLPLIARLERPVHLVGYCLGALLAVAANCLSAAASVSVIAMPWHFGGYDAEHRRSVRALWSGNKDRFRAMDMVPMEMLQIAFWQLSKEKMVRKYVDFASLDASSEAFRKFVAVEDWTNSGSPLPYALAEDLFERMYGENVTYSQQWRIGGRRIGRRDFADALQVSGAFDTLVPPAVGPALEKHVIIPSGHIGMLVGSKARDGWAAIDAHIGRNAAR